MANSFRNGVTAWAMFWVGSRNLPLSFVIFAVATMLVAIACFAKGEPLWWRWGDED